MGKGVVFPILDSGVGAQMDLSKGPRSSKIRPRELIKWGHPGVIGHVPRTLCLGAQSALHCPHHLGSQGEPSASAAGLTGRAGGSATAAAMGGAGGLSQVFGDEALGTGTAVGLNFSLLAAQGRAVIGNGNSCFPNSEGAPLHPASGHQELKGPHSSGLVPRAAEPRLVRLLGQASQCCHRSDGGGGCPHLGKGP